MFAQRSLYKSAEGGVDWTVTEGGCGGFGVALITDNVSTDAGVLFIS